MRCLVVGCGISGATVARCLADLGNDVNMIEERPHIAGNCYDFLDDNGLTIHKYGAHIFHTDNREVWNFISRFTKWYPYQHKVLGLVDGQYVPIPFNLNSIEKIFPSTIAQRLENKLISLYGYNVKIPILELRKSGDKDLSFLADFIYEKIFFHYTLKQWGLTPEDLDPSVTGRVPVVTSRDDRYFQNRYQGIPLQGYTKLIENMLDHNSIRIKFSTKFQNGMEREFDHVFYTGPIDEFFGYEFGELPYRSLQFDLLTFNRPYFQRTAVINYPCNYDFTRICEFKHFLNTDSNKTVISYEYAKNFTNGQNDRYYPVPSLEANNLYKKYLEKARKYQNGVIFLGRLGDYKYYDMDKAIERALEVVKQL